MKKILLLVFAAICIVSCQKEITDDTNIGDNTGGGYNNDTSNVLIGTWTFDSLSSQQHNTSDVNIDGDDYLTVSDYNYTSLGNFGTLTINDSLFKLTGITYSISTSTTLYSYENGVFKDSLPYLYPFYLPPTNSTSKYQLVGTDSVYFPEGGFSADTSYTQPFGMTFKINGNALVFTQPVNLDTTFVNSNDSLTYHETSKGTSHLYFHKQ